MQKLVKIYDGVAKDHLAFDSVDFIRFIRPDGSIPVTVPIMNDIEMYTMRDEKVYIQPIHVVRKYHHDSDPDSVVRSEKYYSFTPEMQEIVDAIVEKHRNDDLKTISMYKVVVEKCKNKYEEINSYKDKIKSLEIDLKWFTRECFESKQILLDFNKQPWYTRVLLAIKGGV